LIGIKTQKNWLKYANTIIPFIGPLAFEISNSVTGDWLTEEGKFNLSTGKFITLFIGFAYIIVMICILCYNEKKERCADELQMQLDGLRKRTAVYEKSNETLCTLLAYLAEKLKEQIDFWKEHERIDVRNLNINSASAHIARIIYQSIIESSDNGNPKITVNIYNRESKSGAEYSMMIAHEGHASHPDAFGVMRILSPDKNNNRYCEKILLSNSPDYRIWLNKKDVAKAFGQNIMKCKYNQYLGIPIRKMGGVNIALIEIVVHGNTVIWKTKDEATQFAANYCEILKEYILLMDRIYEQGTAIACRLEGGV